MSELETEARPLLSQLIHGAHVTLPLEAQLLIGVWITKTVMLLECIEGLTEHQFFTDADRRELLVGDVLTPPYRSLIWLSETLVTRFEVCSVVWPVS